MKEHALPQDVTGYKFHIIGNMTLKQFAEVAIGCGIGFLFYFSNLPTLIKWPLIVIFSGVGALAAFVPFEERPLDQWIVSLFRALYRPTQFYWKRSSKIPEPFLYESNSDAQSMIKEVDLTPVRRQRVTEYLKSVPNSPLEDKIEAYAAQRLNEVVTIFEQPTKTHFDSVAQVEVKPKNEAQKPHSAPVQESIVKSTPVVKPVSPVEPKPAMKELVKTMDVTVPTDVVRTPPPTPPISQQQEVVQPLTQTAVPKTAPISVNPAQTAVFQTPPRSTQTPVSTPVQTTTTISVNDLPTNQPSISFKSPGQDSKLNVSTENIAQQVASLADLGGAPATVIFPDQQTQVSPQQSQNSSGRAATNVLIPQNQTISIAHSADDFSLRTSPQADSVIGDTYITSQTLNANVGKTATQTAVQDKSLPFPAKPSQPNKLVGMTLDQNNTPLANVIVEITTAEGLPARAVKTNILGQFFITTPLANGVYTISAEKAGYTFPSQSLELTGQIVDPIGIKSA